MLWVGPIDDVDSRYENVDSIYVAFIAIVWFGLS